MKKVLVLLALLCAFNAEAEKTNTNSKAEVVKEDSTKNAKSQMASFDSIKELMIKTDSISMGEKLLAELIPNLKAMLPDAPDSFWKEVQSLVKFDDLVQDKIIPIYAKYLTQEDVDAALKFYSSPAGQNFIKSQSPIYQESVKIGQEYGEKLSEDIIDRYQKLQATKQK